MFVKVAIDLALNRLFTYEVPEALQKKLAIGQLLSVPFGHRQARGFAIELTESAPDGIKVKPIIEIVDEAPFFSSALLMLVRRLSAYTLSPLESMLKAALPAAVLKRNIHPRELMFIAPAMSPVPVKLTKRQSWLYDQIVRLGGGWMSQLCRELQTTPTTIRQLGALGLVRMAIREKRRDPLAGHRVLPTRPLPLNAEQRAALAMIADDEFSNPVLLFGVTGSGKTEVYLQAIAAELSAGRGAIVMVPEISLTPQTVQRFASRFGAEVAVLHSALSDGERYDEWHRIRAGTARVVVGPRSAVFAPVKNLGLIVVDEEHDTSYKQEDTPRYNARDAAVLRGAIEGAKVVLGSATPSLESWLNAKLGKYRLVKIEKRAGFGTLPTIELIDMTAMGGGEKTGGSIFSGELLAALRACVERGEQAMLFLNRRGYSRSMRCAACGATVDCDGCGVPYTYHQADGCLRCHICGKWILPPRKCGNCGCTAFDYRGIGTQRAEAALKKCLPGATILRMDADSTSRKNSHDDILSAFRRGEGNILLGTQMITKGLDFPNVTLVGVINADASMNMPDFRAMERTFQLLSQVAGRAGRSELSGRVMIQSYDIENKVLNLVMRGDFEEFANQELAIRKEAGFPPYCHLAVVTFKAKDLKMVGDWAQMYAQSMARVAKAKSNLKMLVSEAMPAPLEKADGWYRWQIIIRSAGIGAIAKVWEWLTAARPAPKDLRVSIDIDAINLI